MKQRATSHLCAKTMRQQELISLQRLYSEHYDGPNSISLNLRGVFDRHRGYQHMHLHRVMRELAWVQAIYRYGTMLL